MKRLFATGLAGIVLAGSVGVPAFAYEPKSDTSVEAEPKGEVKPGKKARIVVRPNVAGDVEQCRGKVVLKYVGDGKVLKRKSKGVAKKVAFNTRVPRGTTRIVAIYKPKNKKDPCRRSRSGFRV